MRPISSKNIMWTVALFAILATGFAAQNAIAMPTPDGAVINTRIWNDCPTSVLTTTNNYSALIAIEDLVLDCGGFANLHNWRFAEGGSEAVFSNGDAFSFSASLVISGTSDGEAGLQVSPWWSQQVDGRLNIRTTDGEIACFGGRLPFYSFTGSHGINYVKGTTIDLEIIYLHNDLTMANPATIEYVVVYGGMTYSSGPLPFDEGNPAEDPPYGLWGMLNDARVGGHFQPFLQGGNPDAGLMAEWREISLEDLGSIPTESATWGSVKTLYR